MKIVVCSDLHPDRITLGVRRFEEVERATVAAAQYAVDEGAEVFLFLGDLADPDSGGDSFAASALSIRIAMFLQLEGVRSVWIAGNHDVCEDGTGATTLTPLKALEPYAPFVDVAEQPRLVWLDQDELAVACLPFAPASHGYEAAPAATAMFTAAAAARVIVVGHLMLPGIHPGSETTDMPRGREVTFPFAETRGAVLRLNGHYHKRQEFDPGDGGPPILIPGSLARLAFDEQDHEPAFLVLDTGAS